MKKSLITDRPTDRFTIATGQTAVWASWPKKIVDEQHTSIIVKWNLDIISDTTIPGLMGHFGKSVERTSGPLDPLVVL